MGNSLSDGDGYDDGGVDDGDDGDDDDDDDDDDVDGHDGGGCMW